jgi:hypothetical protein
MIGHRGLVDRQPVQAQSFHGRPELIEVYRLLDIIRVQISCLTTFRTLKTLGITQL